ERPLGLSLLASHDPDAEVAGLEAFPQRDWPPTRIVHASFQIMVGAGSALALVAAGWALALARRRRLPVGRVALGAVIAAGPLGGVGLEGGGGGGGGGGPRGGGVGRRAHRGGGGRACGAG